MVLNPNSVIKRAERETRASSTGTAAGATRLDARMALRAGSAAPFLHAFAAGLQSAIHESIQEDITDMDAQEKQHEAEHGVDVDSKHNPDKSSDEAFKEVREKREAKAKKAGGGKKRARAQQVVTDTSADDNDSAAYFSPSPQPAPTA